MNAPDHRRHPRVAVTRPVRIRTSSGVVVHGRTANISVAGIAIMYESPAELGATLDLSFSLPVRGREVEFHERCTAIYNYLSGEGYIIGFQFAALGRDALENLREFVAFKRSLQDR